MVLCGRETPMHFASQLFGHYLAFIGNTILPFRIGELIRIDYVSRNANFPLARTIGVVIAERAMDMLFVLTCLAVLMSIQLLDTGSSWKLKLAAGFAIGLLLAITFAAILPKQSRTLLSMFLRWIPEGARQRLGGQVRSLANGLAQLSDWIALLKVVGLTVARWAIALLTFSLSLLAFGIDIVWYAPLLILCFLALGTMLPSTIAYVGTYHFAFVSSLLMLSVDQETALAVAVVAHALTFTPPTLIAAAWIAVRSSRGQAPWRKLADGETA